MEKIKTLEEYAKLAARTCPNLGTYEKNNKHHKYGVISEFSELIDPFKKELAYGKTLDLVNLAEEIGDGMWYAVNGIEVNNRLLPLLYDPMYVPSTKDEICDYILLCLEAFLQRVDFAEMIQRYYVLCLALKIDFFQALTNNIAKLAVRYPEKFDAEKALNRDLEAERLALVQDAINAALERPINFGDQKMRQG